MGSPTLLQPKEVLSFGAAAIMSADILLPTGGEDFLSRLSFAEARDEARAVLSSRPPNVPTLPTKKPTAAAAVTQARPAAPPALKKQASKRQKTQPRELTFHPRVVTGGCFAHGENELRRMNTANPMTDISMYTPEEEQYAIERQMTKMHLKQMTRQVDGEMRRKINAVAADEAWKRADELRLELEYHGVVNSDGCGETLQQRQNTAARRCAEQFTSLGSARQQQEQEEQQQQQQQRQQQAQAPTLFQQQQPTQQRPPSARRPAATPLVRTSSVPGRAVLRRTAGSPRPSAAPKQPSPRPRGSAASPNTQSRTSTRVRAPPGGGSSFVFG